MSFYLVLALIFGMAQTNGPAKKGNLVKARRPAPKPEAEVFIVMSLILR